MVSNESLNFVHSLHSAFLIFNELPVCFQVGIVRIELSHECDVGFLLLSKISLAFDCPFFAKLGPF